ncbi:DNA sulfur modification protein DndE [Enterobacter hormaechei]|uniref:DNA sulfur modification protein DndE n=1 Tax=Enterobacter quasihormaechei TaxID=2529382 RepID=A0ABU9PEA0_9ENTR|nr:DNA sulfur modification protein DndE [Enterobacter hormaechei]HDR2410511.1 DNA sulfur modification protein DndE [Enterobacter bugandensis]MBG0571754.1 DNA sulfur modification protein DndE [Enterobacter hormaechei]MCJ8525420.1 DNA sulfur modification protein DndE [Enterobacter hormaechei]MDN3795159.1 DNA sulfur modification protein DndE [Enterobacter hormaechei]MDU3497493.1 DNA sulfur modification protein DndE [Enterobacter hormaechei]
MLPNRMQLSRKTEEQLKKLKSFTSVTPNIAARIAFFRSIENGFRVSMDNELIKLDGQLTLDKITWLGETLIVTELILRMCYPEANPKDIVKIWASHVEDGISSIRNHKDFLGFCQAL